ncbi:MAG: glycoside hydrolase family 36 protein [Acutalibacteraceae bacterium]
MKFNIINTDNSSQVKITNQYEENGIEFVEIKYHSDILKSPETFYLQYKIPCIDVYSTWGHRLGAKRNLGVTFGKRSVDSRAACGQPVHQLISASGQNRLLTAVSDATCPIKIRSGICEHTGNIEIEILFFVTPTAFITDYKTTVRIDKRDIPYHKALKDVSVWYETDCGYTPVRIPASAKEPIDSLWYSFHQELSTEEILKECKASAEIGLKTVIIDDGWQTENCEGGYKYCGDWELCPSKIPDMKYLSDEIHKLGMKLMLWFSVPFVGMYSKHYNTFSNKFLGERNGEKGVSILDPRYPDVREYLINTYKKAVTDWNLDGLKLDFIDCFEYLGETEDLGRDTVSVEDGLDLLMKGVYNALKEIKPDILIEFRQDYIGPMIRQYGNLLRVSDCADDPYSNRLGIGDIRLTAGNTPATSDMIMWHKDDTNEAVALQLASVLCSVPQISVRVDKLSQDHKKVLKFYIDFWQENKEILLDGDFVPYHPEYKYTRFETSKNNKSIITLFTDKVVDATGETTVVNATGDESIYIKNAVGKTFITVNCKGETVVLGEFIENIEEVQVPVGGMIFITE